MFKIDKSTWEQMSSNKSRIIKQWTPESYKVDGEIEDEAVEDVLIAEPENEKKEEIDPEEKREQIINLALKEAEEIKTNAYREGYSGGMEKARQKFAEICDEQNAQLNIILREIEESKKRFDAELEEKTLKLSISVAEKILNMKLENDDKLFVGMVKDTLALMDKGEKFILKLNNREYEKHYKNKCEAFQKELQCDVPVTIIKDVSLKAGGLILESEKSFVDASVDTQLKRIANSLTQRDKQYHEAL